jgi:uncharacterized membrane protein
MILIQKIIHAITQVYPPHPIFVHFPIALTGAALFFIILALWRKSEILEKVAFANISLACVSTIFAAFMGIRDNAVFYNGAATNHTVKIILACTLFLVTLATTVARWRNPKLFHAKTARIFYILGYFISFALAMVLGFLGGVIIYGL